MNQVLQGPEAPVTQNSLVIPFLHLIRSELEQERPALVPMLDAHIADVQNWSSLKIVEFARPMLKVAPEDIPDLKIIDEPDRNLSDEYESIFGTPTPTFEQIREHYRQKFHSIGHHSETRNAYQQFKVEVLKECGIEVEQSDALTDKDVLNHVEAVIRSFKNASGQIQERYQNHFLALLAALRLTELKPSETLTSMEQLVELVKEIMAKIDELKPQVEANSELAKIAEKKASDLEATISYAKQLFCQFMLEELGIKSPKNEDWLSGITFTELKSFFVAELKRKNDGAESSIVSKATSELRAALGAGATLNWDALIGEVKGLMTTGAPVVRLEEQAKPELPTPALETVENLAENPGDEIALKLLADGKDYSNDEWKFAFHPIVAFRMVINAVEGMSNDEIGERFKVNAKAFLGPRHNFIKRVRSMTIQDRHDALKRFLVDAKLKAGVPL